MHSATSGYFDEAIIRFVISLITVRMMTQALRCRAEMGYRSLTELEDAGQLLEEINVTTHILEKELQQLKIASGL